ncbi:hypothetical protein IV203_026537 [Nitzschia inconspicua]|uniref:Uncharacterized protein n=1 Tax=Nitzschia inconspicua TaxID=303405 RepID=A0A9K3PX88_9STRA|nr:hypothetical protein IV203_026537 [Nitzschia inconspicua]
MKFSCAAIVALCVLQESNAFFCHSFIKGIKMRSSPDPSSMTTTTIVSMADDGFSEDFLEALKGKGGTDKGTDDEEEEDVGSGSSRFKELIKAAQQRSVAETPMMPRPIENPFLNPSPSIPPMTSQSLASSPDELSVEEQARLFRELMAQQQGNIPAVPPPLPDVQRVAKTDRAGRPVGRNRDADSIANTADLYFAQLKRDSTVRTMARLRGEIDIAERVFEDEGIKQLDDLLQKNPYLKGQREKDMEIIDEIPVQALAPYFKSDGASEEEKTKSGPSYKKKLMERRQKQQIGSAAPPVAPTSVTSSTVANHPEPSPEVPVKTFTQVPETIPETPAGVTAQATTHNPPVVNEQYINPASQASSAQQSTLDGSNVSSAETSRQNIRTLMGMILKHRGGPGFGKGRLKGPEIDRFETLLLEVSGALREEAKSAQPVNAPLASTNNHATLIDTETPSPLGSPAPSVDVPAPGSRSSSSANIDATIACIEGAITMYKNCPPELKQSVLVTLRAALVAAVDTCNCILISQPPPAIPGNPEGKIDNTITVIEGAISMYKNSPPALQESVLVTLRAALISAVQTCAIVVGGEQQLTPSPSQAVISTITQNPATSTTQVAPTSASPPTIGTDPNSRRLEEIYDNVQAAAGDGKLGLRKDLMPEEANDLADQLVEMRRLLMEELESGIPDPEPVVQQGTLGGESSAASKYQQMLAKAREEKTAG